MQAGKTRTLSGPGTFSASGSVQGSQTMGTAVSRMLAQGPTMRSRGGFSRGPDEPAPVEMRDPNVPLLDYRERRTFCVADPQRTMLRPPHQASNQLSMNAQGGQAAPLGVGVGGIGVATRDGSR